MGYEVDFLDVGDGERSGDAIALRFGNLFGDRKEQTVVVIDGGFKDTGEKLVSHIRNYYNTNYVDIVISTHPDADHVNGLQVVLEKLGVGCLWMHRPWQHTRGIADLIKDGRVTDNSIKKGLKESLESACDLERCALAKNIPIIEPFAGLSDTSGCLWVVGPTKEYYESLLPGFIERETADVFTGLLSKILSEAKEFVGKIAESWGYETLDDSGETTPINNSSAIILLSVDNKQLLFTGDAGIPSLTLAADILEAVGIDRTKISLIQVPHHGSRRNIGPTILNNLIGPKLDEDKKIKTAIISAAKDGAPKHPAKKVTNAFRRRGARVWITQGKPILHHNNAPQRVNYYPTEPLPFYNEVEE